MRFVNFLTAAMVLSIVSGCVAVSETGKKSEQTAPAQVVFDNAKLIGVTNKSALSYQPGEEMIFTCSLDLQGQKTDGLFISYTRKGDDGKTFSGKVPASEKAVVKTSLDKPGFVSVNFFVTDANGKNVKQEYTRGDKSKRTRNIAFYGGAAVEPEKLSDCGEPADFDAFWAKQKKRLAAVPFEGKVDIKKVKTTRNTDIYAVSIPCAGPRPATGYLYVPVGAKAKSLPAIISFYGYGNHIQKPGSGNSGMLHFSLNAHGQELGRDKAYYDEFFKSIKSNGKNYAFDPIQNADPETAFFNGMTMRVMRALEYLKSRPEWNGKDLTAAGGSQGGLQTMWAAALDPDVTVAKPSITWCCNLAGTEKQQRLSGSWRIKYVPALDYYDPVFMAKRIKNARVEITRAGLGDYTCPPSGLAISYKNIASPHKSIRWVQGSDHGFIPEKSEVVVWSTAPKQERK